MTDTIDQIIEKVAVEPLFLKLKEVVENNAHHNHESVYDHLVKTKNIAQREISGEFITNSEVKKLFLQFVNEELYGFKKADLMILIALLHDVGKVLSISEKGKISPVILTDSKGETKIPGHEYWGSTIIEKFLKNVSMPKKVVEYISTVVEEHDAFQGEYIASKTKWPIEDIIYDIKSRAQGLYIESMFNNFCDVYTALPFQPFKQNVIDIFSSPSLYQKREYVLP